MKKSNTENIVLDEDDNPGEDISGLLNTQTQKQIKKQLDSLHRRFDSERIKAQRERDKSERDLAVALDRDAAREVDTTKNQDVLGQVINNSRTLTNMGPRYLPTTTTNKTDNRAREFLPKFFRSEITKRVQNVLDDFSKELDVDDMSVVSNGVIVGWFGGYKYKKENDGEDRNFINPGGDVNAIISSNKMNFLDCVVIKILFGQNKQSLTFKLDVWDLWTRIRGELVKPVDSSDNLNNIARDRYLGIRRDSLYAMSRRFTNSVYPGVDVLDKRFFNVAKAMTGHTVDKLRKVNTNDSVDSVIAAQIRQLANEYDSNKRVKLFDGEAPNERVYFKSERFRHLTFRWISPDSKYIHT